MTTTIRLLTPADAASYFAFRRASLNESPWAFLSSPEDDRASGVEAVAQLLDQAENKVAAGVDAQGRILAAAGVFRAGRKKIMHRVSIWGVYCLPDERGRGLGKAVMQLAIETGRSWPGVEVIGLSVSAKAVAARRMYESLGFKVWGTEPDALRIDGERLDEIYMVLRADSETLS